MQVNLTHTFWDKMPVSNKHGSNNEIIELKNNKTFISEPYKLPTSLSWYEINIDDKNDINDLINFLNSNYHSVNSDIKFIFDENLIKWFLGYNEINKQLAIGIKNKNKLVGCIFGLVRNLNLNKKIVRGSETNLLCLDKKIRNLNLAPILIQELTRRNNYILKINQSIYTTTLTLPNILTSVKYLYRPLNYKKLLKLNCLDKSLLNYNDNILRNHFHKVENKIIGKIIKLKNSNLNLYLNDILVLLNKKLMESNLSYIFDENLFKHTFINDAVDCWLIKKKGKITDMISCYYQNCYLTEEKTNIKNCNLFFYFNTVNKIENIVSIVINNCLTCNVDRIKVLGILDYSKLTEFNFDEGNANINYYIYNWETTQIDKSNIGYIVF